MTVFLLLDINNRNVKKKKKGGALPFITSLLLFLFSVSDIFVLWCGGFFSLICLIKSVRYLTQGPENTNRAG